jgi:hypothetical protein
MKQYLSSEQTAKLIELGLPKPKTKVSFEVGNDELGYTYSIGELIEMLPEAICESKDDDYHYFLSIETDSLTWKVFYESEDEVTLCSTFGEELIDALYDMVVKLKEEGVI